MAPSPPHHSSSSLSKRTLTLARIRKKTKKPSSSPQLPCTGCSSCCWSIDTVQTKGLRASYSCECRGSEPNKQNTQTQRRTGISVRACDGGIQTAKNPPFPSLERADSGARRRGKKTERCEHCEREYSHDSGSTYSLHSPLTGTDSLLCPDHLAQHPERRQQEVGLITFFFLPARQHRWSARQID